MNSSSSPSSSESLFLPRVSTWRRFLIPNQPTYRWPRDGWINDVITQALASHILNSCFFLQTCIGWQGYGYDPRCSLNAALSCHEILPTNHHQIQALPPYPFGTETDGKKE